MSQSVVFIDSRVAHPEEFLRELGSDTEIVPLAPGADGVLQMAAALAGRTGLDAIHLIAHGACGRLDLGSLSLSGDNLQDHAAALAAIGRALSPTGDLLLYGCDVAAGEAGPEFVTRLSALTGADVAASTDATGAAALGGDWTLEYAAGAVETPVIAAPHWDGLLTANTAPSFRGGDGVVITPVAGLVNVQGVALQPDGKTIVAGLDNNGFGVVRYDVDGTLDTSFDGDGRVRTDFPGSAAEQAQAVVVQADGKILVVGNAGTDIALARYNADGTLDTSFDGDGMRIIDLGTNYDQAHAVALLPDGRFVIGGRTGFDMLAARFNPDGSFDTSFGGTGKVTVDDGSSGEYAFTLALQSDGKVLLAGSAWSVLGMARLNADGTPDTGFGTGGKLTTSFGGTTSATSMVVQADGRILVAGDLYTAVGGPRDLVLARYLADGTLDTSFDLDGKLVADLGGDDTTARLALQPDGHIVLTGTTTDASGSHVGVLRFQTGGAADTTFSGDGRLVLDAGGVSEAVNAVALGADGSISLAGNAGNSNLMLVRLTPGGTLDLRLDAADTLGGTLRYAQGYPAVTLDADVRLYDFELASAGHYGGATLMLERHGGADGADMFSGANIVAGQASGSVIVSATAIGGYTWSAGRLLITFNASATQALVDQAAQGIAYRNLTEAVPATVQIDWTLSDGSGALAQSATGSITVHLAEPNDAPSIAVNAGLSLLGGATGTIGKDLLDEGDPDDEGAGLTYTVTSAAQDGMLWLDADADGVMDDGEARAAGGTFTQADIDAGRLQFTHYNVATGTDRFDFRLADGGEEGAAPVDGSFTITATTNSAPSFAFGSGHALADHGSTLDTAQAVTVQPDGKILLAGFAKLASWDYAVSRFNRDGSPDTGFGVNGKLTTHFSNLDYARGILVQPDGRIIAAGHDYADFTLARYTASGALDTTFGSYASGKVSTDFGSTPDTALGLIQQANGQLVLAGASNGNFALARYNTNGTLDSTFDTDGKLTTDFGSTDNGFAVAQQPDGRLVVAGISNMSFAVARYNANGSLDTTFDADGKVVTDVGNTTGITRFNFDGNNYNITGVRASMALQPDGRIVVAGTGADGDFAVVRYNANGSLDTTFGGDGKVATDLGGTEAVHSVAVQADGRILVAGTTGGNMALVRYLPDGSLDDGFGIAGKRIIDLQGTDIAFAVRAEDGGKILLAGESGGNAVVLRLNTDGTLDGQFGPPFASTLDGTPAFTEGGSAVILDGDVRVYDAELSSADNFTGAMVTLARQGGASADDRFEGNGIVAGQGSGAVVVSGTSVGTYAWSAGTLAVTFNGDATGALVDQALQGIAYSNGSDAPPASVTIAWTFSDGNGGPGSPAALSTSGSTTVSITSVPDGVVGGVYPADQTILEDVPLHLVLAPDTFIDPDGEALVVTASVNGAPLPDWLSFDGPTLTFSGTPANDDVGTIRIEVQATDPTLASVMSPFWLTVVNVNDAPILDTPPSPAAYEDTPADDAFAPLHGTLSATDEDGDTLTWGIEGGVASEDGLSLRKTDALGTLTVVKATGSYAFEPDDAAIEALTADTTVAWTFTASDGSTTATAGITFGFTASDDPLEFSGSLTGDVTEDAALAASGVLHVSDRDAAVSVVPQAPVAGLFGIFEIDADGHWSYQLDNAAADVQALADGDSRADDFVVQASDGSVQTVSITVRGATEPVLLSGNGRANDLRGTAAVDRILGYGGNDTLDGGAGADILEGGNGNDTYVVDDPRDTIVELGAGGLDTVLAWTSYVLPANVEQGRILATGAVDLEGNAGNNTLFAGTGDNLVDGGDGIDMLSYLGHLAAVTVSLELTGPQATGGSGSDTVLNFERLSGTDLGDLLTGNAGPNVLLGNSGHDTLRGGVGNDVLDGGSGGDWLEGGAGNDTYHVDDAGDLVIELEGQGKDTVVARISHALAAQVEQLRLIGDGAIDGTGNALDNTIYAALSDNVLDGGDGIDTLSYAGHATGVTVRLGIATPQATGGSQTDTVLNFERLTGSQASDLLAGDVGNNTLTGSAGDDTLLGEGGNDLLAGGAGNDWMSGGPGNDTYRVDAPDDQVIEHAGEGMDTVEAGIDWVLGADVENLTLEGDGALHGSGNALNNVVTGNAGANVLHGGEGNDQILGRGGNDVLFGDAGNDTFVFDRLPSANNVDLIADFTHGADRIRLDDDVFTAFRAGVSKTVSAAQFLSAPGATAAVSADQRLVYDSLTGHLHYDADGTGGVEAVQVATILLAGIPAALTASDFTIVA